MIRINLLARERERAPRKPVFARGQQITVASTLILVVAALLVGWWYWSLRKDAAKIDEEIAAAQQETARLRSLIVQVQQFETRKTQLQQRVTLIEQLRRGQSGPVHLIDEISRSLPDMLWLTELKQNGADLTISGRCTVLTALSDFVGNLEASGWFKKPVEIVDSQVERVSGAGGAGATGAELVRFTIKAQFAPPAG
jgi:type IV pilus assembly protein PilN